MKNFKKYMRRTIKNKLCSMALLSIGIITQKLTGDGTVLLFFLILGLPLFFARENYIY